MDNEPRSKIILDEFNKGCSCFSSRNTSLTTQGCVCTRAGKALLQWEACSTTLSFHGLGMVPEDPEMSPCNYNEAIQDNDVTLRQKDKVNLQEEENDRYKDVNLMGMTSSEGKIS